MKILGFYILMLTTVLASAQSDDIYTKEKLEPKVTFDFDVKGAMLQGDFKNNYKYDGMMGAGLTTLFPISKNNPVDVGIDIAYFFMSATESSHNYYDSELRLYDVNSEVTGAMIPLHLVVRLYPLKHTQFKVQPYVEGMFGGKLFSIDQTITTYTANSSIILKSENITDVTSALSYGYGVGLKMRISKNNLLYLNAKAAQLFGDETDYLDASSYRLSDNGAYKHLYNRSKTDLLQFSLGLHLMIE